MFDTHKKVGPVSLVSVFIFLAHAILVGLNYYSTSQVRAPASVGALVLPWFTIGYPFLLSLIPAFTVLGFSFLFMFAGSGGPANAKAFGLALMIAVTYTFFAHIIQLESPEPFFAPAMLLLPVLYGIIYLTSYFSIWLAE